VSIGFPTELHSQRAASAANRWQGGLSGYSNPGVDSLLDRYAVTISRPDRLAIHRELLQVLMGDVAGFFPVLFKVEGVLAVAGVGPLKGRHAWNVFEWSKQ
jgi:hypothetical protein